MLIDKITDKERLHWYRETKNMVSFRRRKLELEIEDLKKKEKKLNEMILTEMKKR